MKLDAPEVVGEEVGDLVMPCADLVEANLDL